MYIEREREREREILDTETHRYIDVCMHTCIYAYIHTYIHTELESDLRTRQANTLTREVSRALRAQKDRKGTTWGQH